MENMERFIDLINGDLGEDAERVLFSELASNDDLRSDFKCFSAVTGSIKSNMNTFAPSKALKAGIYSKAGISLPASEFIAPVQSTKGAFYQSSLFKNILTGVLTLVATIVIMLLFFEPKGSGIDSNENNLTRRNDLSEVPFSKSYESDKTSTPQRPQQIIKYVYLEKKSIVKPDEIALVDTENNKSKGINLLTLSEPLLKNNNFQGKANTVNSINRIPDNFRNNYDFISLLNIHNYGLNIDFKSSSSWNLPKETINPTQFSKMNNLSLDLFYKISDDLKIGAGVKQETFYTEYDGVEGNEYVFKYMQQPNLTTFSVIGKYYPNNFKGIRSFAQLGLGINVAGWVAKPLIGIEYFPVDNFSVLIAFEYSYFSFKHQNNSFSSNKAGLNYGLSFHF